MAANGSASTALPAPNGSTASTVSPPAGWEITPYNQQSTWEIIPYFPVPDRRTTLKEFYYKMNGEWTGYLYLISGPRLSRQCCWRSRRTRWTTPWHGEWSATHTHRENLHRYHCVFDFNGRASHKWTTVEETVESSASHGVYRGYDYMGRVIQMHCTRMWFLDE